MTVPSARVQMQPGCRRQVRFTVSGCVPVVRMSIPTVVGVH